MKKFSLLLMSVAVFTVSCKEKTNVQDRKT